MKKVVLSLFTLISLDFTAAAQVGINNPTPDNSAVLDLSSTNKGLLIPRMNSTQRGNITSPAVGLMVYQTDAPVGFYYFSGSGWTYLNPLGDNLGSHTATQNLGLNGNWLSNNGDSTGLRITDAGFVGINNQNPQYRLHLESDGLGSGATDDFVMNSYGGTPGISLQLARGTKAAPENLQNGDYMGIIGFGGRRNGVMSFSLSAIASFYAGDGTTPLTDMAFVNSGVVKMTLASSGNLGINVFNPLTRLSINPTVTEPKITLWDGGNAVDHYGFGVSSTQLNYHVDGISSRHVFYAGGKNGNGTELMRVQGNGFIGINDVNPQSKLSISSNTTEPKITLWDGNSTVNHYGFGVSSTQLNYHVDFAGSSHVFYQSGKNGDGKELMRIKGTGQVGIGNSNPNFALTVRDTLTGLGTTGWFEGNHSGWAGVNTNAMKATANPSWSYSRQGVGLGAHFIDTDNKWHLWLNNGTGALYTRMTIEGLTGRVGIGITTPQQALHVVGNMYAQSSLGVMLDAQDRPLITRGWDAFTSGTYTGTGRWGLFMEPHNLTFGVPALGGKQFQWVTYNDNSTVASQLMQLSQTGTLRIGTLAGSGSSMVVADNNGDLSTQALPVGDNLGNHTATTNLGLNNNWLSNATGNANGIRISNTGKVGIGYATPLNDLTVSGNAVIGSGASYLAVTAPANGLLVQGQVVINNNVPMAGKKLYVLNDNTGAGQNGIFADRTGSNISAASGGSNLTRSTIDAAVVGNSTWGNNFTAGLAGFNYLDDFTGVTLASVIGVNSSNSLLFGALGFRTGSTSYAGYFNGNVHVNGTLSKSAGTFRIDHPQDPENKYLVHSFVESPEMMNVYNGNITTGADGLASVALPGYFEAENKDFKYQLTVIGQFAQAIVKEKVQGNRFVIQTDKPGVEVSWQVTGVRNDKWAQQHPIVVEEPKQASERGKYLNPEVFGKSGAEGIVPHLPAQPDNREQK